MKKQVVTWIVTGVVAAGGVAMADSHEVLEGETPTVEATTTTLDALVTTTTTVDADALDEGEDETAETADAHEGGGNSIAARDHSHDEECGNHGAWVRANAHARKAGLTTPLEGCEALSADTADEEPETDATTTTTEATTTTTGAPTTTTTVADDATSESVTTESTTHGKGRGKKS